MRPPTLCPCCGDGRLPTTVYSKWSFPIARCLGCGFGQTVVCEGFDSRSLYDDSYFNGQKKDGYADYLGSEKILRREFSVSLNWFRRYGVAHGDLLEIGCAYGFFLDEASEYFDVRGVEVAKDAVVYCRSQGFNVAESLQAVIGNSTKKLDAIVMLDVIEHLDDLSETFETLRASVRPGGGLMITTGDWGSILARLMGSHWRLMTPPQHLSFFTRSAMKTLLNRHGFQICRLDRPWKVVPTKLMAYQLLNRMGIRNNLAWLPAMGLPVNLLDTMRALAIRDES